MLMELGLGFDTGGTYTDAVLMNISSGKILEKAKSLTTRDDLSIGIRGAIAGFDKKNFKKIVMVSLSSTLATNSIVEGKGCRVGLISVGADFDNSIPVDMYYTVAGGHDVKGREVAPLDTKAAEKALKEMSGKVDGVAITSYMSVRNPDHEIILRDLAKKIMKVPVVCGHELSSSLGFNERTVTSVMNARLIPIIKDLMDSVKSVMKDNGITAPLMIVKGDGSIMGEEIAIGRPIETIISGPAASMIGAKMLTGRNDAIVMDMGGTTTDIGILRNGYPRLEKEGAVIGGRRTRVLAAEIATSGIGGDSRIIVNGGKFMLSALRVVPLCIASSKWPQLHNRLKAVSEIIPRYTPESLDIANIVQDVEFFIKLKDIKHAVLSETDAAFVEYISKEPFSLNEAGAALNTHPFVFNIRKLEEIGIIQRIGVTPTDLLHAEGSYKEYDADASLFGVMHQAQKMRMSVEDFIKMAKDKVITKLSQELLKKLFFEETGVMEPDTVGNDLMNKAISGEEGMDFACSIALNKPIIGIGAPVAAYFPGVAKKFNAELLLPEHSEVGNAIGAITGSIIESLEVLVRPKSGGDADDPACTIFSLLGKFEYETMSEGIAAIIEKGKKHVEECAKKAGADYIDTKVDIHEKKYELGVGFDDKNVLLETEIVITAVGKPKQFKVQQKYVYDEYKEL